MLFEGPPKLAPPTSPSVLGTVDGTLRPESKTPGGGGRGGRRTSIACSSGLEVSGGSVTGSQDPIVDHDNDSDKVESQQGGSSEPDSAARPYGAVVDVLAPL